MAGAVQVGALVINMAADVASLKTSLDEANRQAKSSAEKIAANFSTVRDSIESAVTPLKTLTVSVGSLESNMARAQSSAISLGKGLLLGAAAGMSIDAIKNKIMGVIDTLAHLKEVSEKTGSSVENLSKLNFFAKQTGSDIDSIAAALGKMSKGMAGADNETKGAGLALKYLGISAKDAAGNLKDPAAMFTEVALKLGEYKDGAGKAALAQALFGKAGADMLPTLKLMAEEGDIAAKATTAQGNAAQQYTRDIAKLEAQKGMLFKTLATALLPTMTDFANVLLDASKNANVVNGAVKGLADDKSLEDWADDAGMALAFLIDTFKLFPSLFSTVVAGFKDVAAIANIADSLRPDKMIITVASGKNPITEFKNALAEQEKAQMEYGEKIGALLNKEVDATQKAMQAKIDLRKSDAGKAAVAAKKLEDEAKEAAKKDPNFNTGGEDGPLKAAVANDKEAASYATLISAIKAKTAENRLELASAEPLTESQKTRIKLDEELKNGKVVLTAAHVTATRAALDEQAATEVLVKAKKTEKEIDALIAASTNARNESTAALGAEYALYGQSNDAREIAMVAIKSEAQYQKELTAIRAKDASVSDDALAKLRDERDVRTAVGQATMGQGKALAYASQLSSENKRFAADSIFDEKARAAALLQIDADMWQQRIQQAGDGTEAQKKLQGEYETWYKNQLLKPQLEAEKTMWASIDSTAHDTFVSIFDSGKSAFDRLRDTLKNGLLDLLYQMTIKKWIFSIGASVSAAGVGGAAQAAGTSAAGSAAGSVAGSLAGGLFGAGGLSGSLMAGAGWVTGASTLGGSLAAGASLVGTGTVAGGLAGAGMIVGALAPIALGIAAAVTIWKKIDTSGTYHTGGASSASAAGTQTIAAESLNFQPTQTNAQTEAMTAGLASGIVKILDSTATSFGKTAGYTAATAFADDTSKDGAWGALLINKMGEKIVDWQDTRTSRWAPKEFADGAAGQAEYLASLSTSVRSALDGIGLPAWATKMLDAVGTGASIEDLSKVVDSINATQAALVAMGDKLTGFASMSDSAVSALIAAAGGIDSLTSSASAYYDNFYADSEKTAGSMKQVSDALAAVGVAMPTTRDAFRAQVEAQMALGEAGAPAVAVLLKESAAFAQLVPAAEAAATSTKAASDALAAASAAASAAAAAASAAAAVSKEQRGLDIQLMTATGDAEGALAATRSDALAALLSDQARTTQAQIWAADEASAAIAKAQASAQESATQMAAAEATIATKQAAARATQQAAEQAALQSVGNAFLDSMNAATSAAKALRDFNDSLKLGNLSALTKGQQYDEAKRQYAASPNDQAAATAFLTASKARGGSAIDYAKDFALVIASNSKAAAANEATAAAIPLMWRSFQSAQAMDGSHAGGLGYVPFDGYRAITHKGEGILTAAENKAYRSGGNSGADMGHVAAAIDRLHVAVVDGNKHARKSADILTRVTKDGKSLITTAG